MLSGVPAWVEASPVAAAVSAAYPFVSALHLFGIAVLFGSILPVDLRLLRVLGPLLDEALPPLTRMAAAGFALAAVSGVLLASVRLAEYLQNPAFQLKMAVVLAAGANVVVARLALAGSSMELLTAGSAGRAAGATSLFLWINAVLAGRWIAFV